ncbi:MAG: apolipoprotein N-acyltransferase [Acidimicrobiia bacterium]|nr:apolipoprotein N-acyltransferase [Acidimicrobiia bacterium]
MSHRLIITIRCLAAGFCIAAAMPPWGWWPLAFVGFALADSLLRARVAGIRFRRMALVGMGWFFPSMLWMFDLTPPGYVLAVLFHASLLGVAGAISPPSRWRRVAFPGAVVLTELVRWSWPFGGVPLATLAMSQAQAPLAPTVRVFGALLLTALVVAVGMGLAGLAERHRPTIIGTGVVLGLAALLVVVAPRATVVDTIDVAVVQGGGEQRTRASAEGARLVFERHVAASAAVNDGVDLVLWPENVVNPEIIDEPAPVDSCPLAVDGTGRGSIDGPFTLPLAEACVSELAVELGAPLLPGWFYKVSDTENVNFTDVWLPDGSRGDRYDKVRTVPFGEFVPLRGLIERFAGDSLPARHVRPGTEPAVVETPVGALGVSISWEVFFDNRARDAIGNGGQLLLNPTNGSSYWLTIVQTQQMASTRLRALETDRWVLQAAPTGFSAIIDSDGNVLARTAISEQAVLHGTVELRTGRTWAVRFGVWPMVILAVLAVTIGRSGHRHWSGSTSDPAQPALAATAGA